jgi:hypothetical protein
VDVLDELLPVARGNLKAMEALKGIIIDHEDDIPSFVRVQLMAVASDLAVGNGLMLAVVAKGMIPALASSTQGEAKV